MKVENEGRNASMKKRERKKNDEKNRGAQFNNNNERRVIFPSYTSTRAVHSRSH